jgi:hypothetical protein
MAKGTTLAKTPATLCNMTTQETQGAGGMFILVFISCVASWPLVDLQAAQTREVNKVRASTMKRCCSGLDTRAVSFSVSNTTHGSAAEASNTSVTRAHGMIYIVHIHDKLLMHPQVHQVPRRHSAAATGSNIKARHAMSMGHLLLLVLLMAPLIASTQTIGSFAFGKAAISQLGASINNVARRVRASCTHRQHLRLRSLLRYSAGLLDTSGYAAWVFTV